jgi:hypothetical protein
MGRGAGRAARPQVRFGPSRWRQAGPQGVCSMGGVGGFRVLGGAEGAGGLDKQQCAAARRAQQGGTGVREGPGARVSGQASAATGMTHPAFMSSPGPNASPA